MTTGLRPRLHVVRVAPEHEPLTTSRGVHRGRPGLLLGLELPMATRSPEFWAEASPLPGFGSHVDSLDQAEAALLGFDEAELASWLAASPDIAIDALFAHTRAIASGSARHAIEWITLEALAHLRATGPAELVLSWLRRRSSEALWPGLRQVLATSFVLDLLSPELDCEAQALDRIGIRTWKLKCGRNAEAELTALAGLVRTNLAARIRLDPGCTWTLDLAQDFIRETRRICHDSKLSLELVEDPTPHPGEWGPLAELVPLAADEVLGGPERRLHEAPKFWVLKPMVHGVGGFLELALEGAGRAKLLLASHTFDGPVALRASSELGCVVQTHEHAAGLGPHPALAAWSKLGPADAELLRGQRAFPPVLAGGALVDGPRIARVLSATNPRIRATLSEGAGDGLSISRAAALFGARPLLEVQGEPFSFVALRDQVGQAPALGGAAFAPLLAEAKPSSIVRLLHTLEEGTPVLLLHPAAPEASRQKLIDRCLAHQDELEPGDAVIVPTSGSTAEPHLVVHTRASLLASISASAARLGAPSSRTRWLLSLPFAHVGGLSILLRCLAAGGCVVLEPWPKTPRELQNLLAERQVTHLSLVPTQLRRLLTDPAFAFPPGVECVLVGGALLPPSLRRIAAERGVRILATYGLTEMGSQVATEDPALQREIDDSSVGAALPGVQVSVSARGAMRVGGPMLMRRYLGEAAPLADALFSTSDSGEVDAASRWTVHGRLDDLIITGGENVAPAAVEAILLDVPGVFDACVVGRPSDEWGTEVVAAVVPHPTADEHLEQALRAAARAHLPGYAQPKTYRLFTALPHLESGKIDRRRVAQELLRTE